MTDPAVIENHGYNLGWEFISAHNKAYELKTVTKAELMTKLATQNAQLKDLSKLINALVSKKDSGKADFTNDEKMQELIYKIRIDNQDPISGTSILPANKYKWGSEKEIETTLQVLNDHVKIIAQDVNQTTMLISQETQDTIQLTEISYKTIDMVIRHIESILAKIRK